MDKKSDDDHRYAARGRTRQRLDNGRFDNCWLIYAARSIDHRECDRLEEIAAQRTRYQSNKAVSYPAKAMLM